MIKLIATDVDGTLVKDSSKEVYPEMISVIKELVDKGVVFFVASGRQYASVRKMFSEVSDRIHFIVENGAHVMMHGKNFSVTGMNRSDIEDIMADLRKLYDKECHVVASTSKGCYLESRDEQFIDLIQNSYRNDVTLTDDILAEPIEIIKIAIFKKGSIREIGENLLIPKYKNKVKVCMAGEEWVDFMNASVDKGNALKMVQEALGIKKEETMVFGDNNNDYGMMLAGGESYAVENAIGAVKDVAKYQCDGYDKKGVYKVLKELLEHT